MRTTEGPIKAVITDLDNTLLHTDKSISAYTLQVLQKCREQGILWMVASARPLRNVQALCAPLYRDATAALNGALVTLPQTTCKFGIPRQSGESILEKLMALGDILLSIETDAGLYTDRDIPEWQPTVYNGFPKLPEGVVLYKILVNYQDLAGRCDIQSILTEDTYYTISENRLLQIMSTEATKWKAIQKMLAHFGLTPQQAAYFGDDNDDIQAIQNCGLGVAVANAIPPVLAAADRVTLSNDEDGVAKLIQTFLL